MKVTYHDPLASTADVLVTACPVCVENFNEAKEAGKFKVIVLGISQSCSARQLHNRAAAAAVIAVMISPGFAVVQTERSVYGTG